MTNYPFSNVLGERANRSRRRINRTNLAALVAFLVALALIIWGD